MSIAPAGTPHHRWPVVPSFSAKGGAKMFFLSCAHRFSPSQGTSYPPVYSSKDRGVRKSAHVAHPYRNISDLARSTSQRSAQGEHVHMVQVTYRSAAGNAYIKQVAHPSASGNTYDIGHTSTGQGTGPDLHFDRPDLLGVLPVLCMEEETVLHAQIEGRDLTSILTRLAYV